MTTKQQIVFNLIQSNGGKLSIREVIDQCLLNNSCFSSFESVKQVYCSMIAKKIIVRNNDNLSIKESCNVLKNELFN